MEPIYKLSSGNRISIKDNVIYVKDLTGNIGDVDYVENPDNPDTFIAKTNTTGYSIDTRLRSDIALFLFAYIRTTAGDIEIPVKDNDPVLVDTFELEFAGDGWYVFQLVVIPLRKDEGIYGEATIAYDPVLGLVTLTGSEWLPIKVESIAAMKVTESDKPVLLEGIREKMRLNNKINQLHFNGDTGSHELISLKDDYNNLRLLLRGAFGEFSQGNKYMFQKTAEYITSNHCS
jgi:hypothetical protein